MKFKNLLIGISLLSLLSCGTKEEKFETSRGDNFPAEGFNLAGSDPAAVELADSVMVAMGGRRNWDNTRFISWNFFDRRDLIWDKFTGRVRIESPGDSITYLVNVNTGEGRVRVKGQELEADTLKKMLTRARQIWINDSYWLVMPFKMKDSGVTLKYMGEDSFKTGGKCNVVELRFKEVGLTPQNKYLVYIDIQDNLIKQWAYFANADQDSASFVRPWDNYKQYGKILLSADRSDGGGPKNVKVETSVPEKVFTDF